MIRAAEVLSRTVGVAPACNALVVSRASLYRRRRRQVLVARVQRESHRALLAHERQAILDVLHSERFVDKAPAQVWAELADEGRYVVSIRTMYRVLSQHGEVKERRNQLKHPNHPVPRLVAAAPNQVWSWDITKLLGPVNLDSTFLKGPYIV